MSACCLVCSAAATVYCSNDEAFLCNACDASCHSGALAMRHIRSRVCALCSRKASTVFCRNDDAFLCTECDAQAHANPLAARHIRVPASEAHSGTTAAPAPEHNQPADCVSESAGAVPVTPNALAAGSIVPPAVELPTNQVMDKDALAKAFGKDLEVRQDSSTRRRWRLLPAPTLALSDALC